MTRLDHTNESRYQPCAPQVMATPSCPFDESTIHPLPRYSPAWLTPLQPVPPEGSKNMTSIGRVSRHRRRCTVALAMSLEDRCGSDHPWYGREPVLSQPSP